MTEVRRPDGPPGARAVFDWEAAAVPKVFQKSKKLIGKGLLFERKQKPRMDVRL